MCLPGLSSRAGACGSLDRRGLGGTGVCVGLPVALHRVCSSPLPSLLSQMSLQSRAGKAPLPRAFEGEERLRCQLDTGENRCGKQDEKVVPCCGISLISLLTSFELRNLRWRDIAPDIPSIPPKPPFFQHRTPCPSCSCPLFAFQFLYELPAGNIFEVVQQHHGGLKGSRCCCLVVSVLKGNLWSNSWGCGAMRGCESSSTSSLEPGWATCWGVTAPLQSQLNSMNCICQTLCLWQWVPDWHIMAHLGSPPTWGHYKWGLSEPEGELRRASMNTEGGLGIERCNAQASYLLCV